VLLSLASKMEAAAAGPARIIGSLMTMTLYNMFLRPLLYYIACGAARCSAVRMQTAREAGGKQVL